MVELHAVAASGCEPASKPSALVKNRDRNTPAVKGFRAGKASYSGANDGNPFIAAHLGLSLS